MAVLVYTRLEGGLGVTFVTSLHATLRSSLSPLLRKKLAVNRIQDGSKTLTQVVRRVGLARQELTERMKRAGVQQMRL